MEKQAHLNLYGDALIQAGAGHGADVSLQRADDLDLLAIARIRELVATGRRPVAIDLAAGRGAQALRLADAGALAMASDLTDFSEDFDRLRLLAGVHEKQASFMVANLLEPARWRQKLPSPADMVVCQRAIHYFSAPSALLIVQSFKEALAQGGQIYLSASGLRSELGEGYAHKALPWERRNCPLEQSMASKHGILGPVCLYEEDDVMFLAQRLSLRVERLYTSPFGNIKAVLTND